jgi:hypothetical protein
MLARSPLFAAARAALRVRMTHSAAWESVKLNTIESNIDVNSAEYKVCRSTVISLFSVL